MIKENDLATMEIEVSDEGSAVANAVNRLDFEKEASFCTVEVCNTKQAIEAAKAWSECQKGEVERKGLSYYWTTWGHPDVPRQLWNWDVRACENGVFWRVLVESKERPLENGCLSQG